MSFKQQNVVRVLEREKMKTHGKWANCIGFDKSNKVATAAAEQQLLALSVCRRGDEEPRKKKDPPRRKKKETTEQDDRFFLLCREKIHKQKLEKNLNVLIVKS